MYSVSVISKREPHIAY